MTGVASRMRAWVTSTVHTKIGIRNRVIPGARILKMVVRKLTEPRIEAVPTTARPMIHRSVPSSGEKRAWVSGLYPVQPPAAAPPTR